MNESLSDLAKEILAAKEKAFKRALETKKILALSVQCGDRFLLMNHTQISSSAKSNLPETFIGKNGEHEAYFFVTDIKDILESSIVVMICVEAYCVFDAHNGKLSHNLQEDRG